MSLGDGLLPRSSDACWASDGEWAVKVLPEMSKLLDRGLCREESSARMRKHVYVLYI